MNKKINKTELKVGKKILNQEADAILSLSSSLDQNFVNAIDCINKTKGNLIISGIGKSGHIARKIASTFSSTGTPAFFLHPSEASHGDLGVISKYDTVIILSKSGESKEMSDLLNLIFKLSIPLIAITSKNDSSLSMASKISLSIPDLPEACVLGLAPTTSSIMMLALGDALASALITRKNFKSSDFHSLHPGGKLGQSLTTVEELMHSGDSLPLVKLQTLMSEVIIVMSSKNFGCACVIDESNSLLGVITDGDLRRHMSKDLLNLSAKEVMTKKPKTISPNTLASIAVNKMVGKITNLFVVKKNNLIGIIRLHDCLRAGIK
ncbi:KpsF/GutQ family sugar-phosphate isomerase [Alphaproteobacteria bacterium]|nr:KpsF/GutQ family sugar-phosphate isomerase [Alphaproteobacteria bacterium]